MTKSRGPPHVVTKAPQKPTRASGHNGNGLPMQHPSHNRPGPEKGGPRGRRQHDPALDTHTQVASVLSRAVELGFILTGHAAVMSLNPHGAPKTLHSVALVASPEAGTLAAAAAALANRKLLASVNSRGTLATLTNPAGIQVATLSSYPTGLGLVDDVTWTHPVVHGKQQWSLLHFRPAILRLLLTSAKLRMVLDSFVAEFALGAQTVPFTIPFPDPAYVYEGEGHGYVEGAGEVEWSTQDLFAYQLGMGIGVENNNTSNGTAYPPIPGLPPAGSVDTTNGADVEGLYGDELQEVREDGDHGHDHDHDHDLDQHDGDVDPSTTDAHGDDVGVGVDVDVAADGDDVGDGDGGDGDGNDEGDVDGGHSGHSWPPQPDVHVDLGLWLPEPALRAPEPWPLAALWARYLIVYPCLPRMALSDVPFVLDLAAITRAHAWARHAAMKDSGRITPLSAFLSSPDAGAFLTLTFTGVPMARIY